MGRLEHVKRWIDGVTAHQPFAPKTVAALERTFKLSNPWGGDINNINIRELSLELKFGVASCARKRLAAEISARSWGKICGIVHQHCGEMCNHVQ